MEPHGKMVEICKCCGAVIPDPTISLAPMLLRLYHFVAKHPDCTAERIHLHLYSNRHDGGPRMNYISDSVYTINKNLVGQRIRANRTGPGATYRLYKTEDSTQ